LQLDFFPNWLTITRLMPEAWVSKFQPARGQYFLWFLVLSVFIWAFGFGVFVLVSQISLISLASPLSQKPGPTNLLNHQATTAPFASSSQWMWIPHPNPVGCRCSWKRRWVMRMGSVEDGTSNKSNECFCKLHLNYPLSV